jgi:probable HAF family extracellular repeat protein
MKDLGSLGGTTSYAFSINTAGQVVGYSYLPGDTIFHAFLWTPGGTDGIPDNPQMKDLGGLGGSLSAALGINSAGAITGASGDSAFAAFVWTPDVPNGATGTMIASGLTLGGSQANAFGINDSGTITGSSNLTGDPTYSGGYPVQHAFIAKYDLPNRAPIAAPQTVPTDEDAPVVIMLSATDPDGNPIASYQIVDPPTHGTLLGTAPFLFYFPDRDYNGQDSFTFQASDGTLYGSPAAVTININSVNDAPVAFGIAYSTNEDSPIALGLPAADAEGDALTYSIVSGPTHGTLSGTGNSPLYTPDPNFHGADSFTFKANDGAADSNTATVSIDVLSVNDAPVAVNDSATTRKNTAVTINLLSNDSDVDGDTLTVQSATQPVNGTVVKNADDTVAFTPKKRFIGATSFTYTLSDGHGGTATATVTVTVTR